MHLSLQDEIEDSNSRLLTKLCAILFASSGQLQQLSVCPAEECNGNFCLPRPLMGMISIASSLEYLAVDIPYDHSIATLAESISQPETPQGALFDLAARVNVCRDVCLSGESIVSLICNRLPAVARRLLASLQTQLYSVSVCPAPHTGRAHVAHGRPLCET